MMYFITPCFNENDDIILKNIKSIQNQSSNSEIVHKCIFDGVPVRSTISSKCHNFKNVSFSQTNTNHADYGDYVRRLGTKISIMNKAYCIGYLDADNTLQPNHVEEVLKTHKITKKNIIITKRNIVNADKELLEDNNRQAFFDTNTITFFNDLIKIGLLWGRYHNQLSLIGDRIISQYIKKHHFNDVAYTDKKTVNYTLSRISTKKTYNLKQWLRDNQNLINDNFAQKFGFRLSLE